MDALQDTINTTQQDIEERNPLPGFESVVAPKAPVDQETLFQAKKAREAKIDQESGLSIDSNGVHLGGYTARMWSQDGLVEGLVAKSVGWQMQPDKNWQPLEANNWKMLTQGIPEEFHNDFLNTTSQQHALYTRDLILKKIDDQSHLGDLGTKGNVGRLAFGLVEPTSLLAGIASGGIATYVKGANTVAKASRAINAASKAEASAFKIKALAEATDALGTAAAKEKSIAAVGAGLGTGFGLGYGFERLRQSVNFEDSQSQALEAGLISTAFSAPFVALHVREMNKLTAAAGQELEVLKALEKTYVGDELTPKDHETLKAYEKTVSEISTTELNSSLEEQEKAPLDKPSVPPKEIPSDTPKDPSMREVPVEGTQVFLPEGDSGLVLKELPNNKLLIEDDQTGAKKIVSREDLHPDSPGFMETEAPDGFLPGSVGSAQAVEIKRGVDPTYMANGRLDIYKTLNSSPNVVIQELGHLLVKDAIGNSKTDSQGWSASERKRHFQRTLGGYFHSEAKDAFNEVRKIRGWNIKEAIKNHREFYENVSRVTAGDTDVLIANRDIASQLQKASRAQQYVYKEMLNKASLAGVEGTEGISPKDTYVNRVWRQENLREAINRHGEDAVYRMLANSIRVPALTGDVGKAKQFINAVFKLEYSHALQDLNLSARDFKTLREELKNAKLTDSEINSIVDLMFERKAQESDSGVPTNLKARFNLDESYSETMKDGSTFGVRDLLENDSRILVDKYLNSMAGHTALAEKGITSRAEWQRRLKESETFHDPVKSDPKQYTDHVQLLQDMYDNISGRPMSTQSFNKADRFLAAFRAYARSTYLGQLGIAAAFEMKNAIGLATIRSAMTQMPSFSKIIRALRNGHIPSDSLASDIRMMTGFGTERAAAYTRQHELTDFTYDRHLSKFESYANEASHYVDILSGNNSFTSFTRELSAKMMVQKYADFATGKKKLTAKARERLVHNGLDDHRIDYVMDQIKKYTKRDESGRVEEIDWENWSQEDPQSYSDFQLSINREVRDAIQEHDIGETLPFQHTTLGKVMTELKVFSIAAHSKQFLKGLHYRDSTTATTWMISFIGEALAYSMQTSFNFAHNKDELNKRLTPERVAKAAVSRMSVLGVVPMLLDTPYKAVTGQGLFSNQGLTANTDNRDLFATPSTLLAQRMLGTAQAAGQAISPFSSTVTTKGEVRDAFSLLPGSNLWLMRNLNDYVSSGFPAHEIRLNNQQ